MNAKQILVPPDVLTYIKKHKDIYLFLKLYARNTLHFRRLQASALLEKYKEKEIKTRKGVAFEEWDLRVIRSCYALGVFERTYALTEDYGIFCIALSQGISLDLERQLSSDFGGRVDQFYEGVDALPDSAILEIVSLPVPERLECFTQDEKQKISEYNNAIIKRFRQHLKNISRYRKMFRNSYLKIKHGMTAINFPGPYPNWKGEELLPVGFLYSSGNKAKRLGMFFSDSIIEKHFTTLCGLQENLRAIINGKCFQIETGGKKIVASFRFGDGSYDDALILMLQKKQVDFYKITETPVNFDMKITFDNPKDHIEFMEKFIL